jgi:hypothetical protein
MIMSWSGTVENLHTRLLAIEVNQECLTTNFIQPSCKISLLVVAAFAFAQPNAVAAFSRHHNDM